MGLQKSAIKGRYTWTYKEGNQTRTKTVQPFNNGTYIAEDGTVFYPDDPKFGDRAGTVTFGRSGNKLKWGTGEFLDDASKTPGRRYVRGHGVGWKPTGNKKLGYNESDGYFYYLDGNTINRKWTGVGNGGVYTAIDGTRFEKDNVTFGYSGIVKNWATGEIDNRQTSLSMDQRAVNRQDDRNEAATLLNIATAAISLTPACVLGDVAEAVEAIEAVSVADRAMQVHNDIEAAELMGHQNAFAIAENGEVIFNPDLHYNTIDNTFGYKDDLIGFQTQVAEASEYDTALANCSTLGAQVTSALSTAANAVMNGASAAVTELAENKAFYATTTGIGIGGMAASNALADNGKNEQAIHDTVKFVKGTSELLYDKNPITAVVAGTQLAMDVIRGKKEQANGYVQKQDRPTMSRNSTSESSVTRPSHTETDDHRQAAGWHADVRFDREGFERRCQF
jgi:hypothetical protein